MIYKYKSKETGSRKWSKKVKISAHQIYKQNYKASDSLTSTSPRGPTDLGILADKPGLRGIHKATRTGRKGQTFWEIVALKCSGSQNLTVIILIASEHLLLANSQNSWEEIDIVCLAN